MSSRQNKLISNQRGMAAIVVTVVLMLVISLIVIGFAQVTQRQQRDTLDRQLSSQAFYAAESGINYAQGVINQKLASSQPITEKTECGDTGTGDYTGYVTLSPSASITCLLVNKDLTYYSYDNVGFEAIAAKLKPLSGSVNDIEISWQSVDDRVITDGGCNGSDTAGALRTLASRTAAGCKQPMIRVDLVPLSGGSPTGVMTTFFSPTAAVTASVSYVNNSVQGIKTANCTVAVPAVPEAKKCIARFTALPGAPEYAIRVMSIYGSSNVVVFINDGNTKLTDGQVQIDSTAKSVDILRRVRSTFTPKQDDGKITAPDFAITATGGICKRFSVRFSGVSADPAFSAYPMCQLP